MILARVGCINEASYSFIFQTVVVDDTAFMHPTLAALETVKNLTRGA